MIQGIKNWFQNIKEKSTRYINSAYSIFSNIWLIGSLFKAGRKTYAQALYEFAYLLCWSVLPFALGTLTLLVTADTTDQRDVLNLSISTFNHGELLVFTISMLAPILYLINHDPTESKTFPHKLPISTIVVLNIVTSASLFALMKADAVTKKELVFNISVALTVIALLIRYLALVYHRVRLPDVDEMALRSNQRSFVEDYEHHMQAKEQFANTTQSTEDFINAFGNHLESEK